MGMKGEGEVEGASEGCSKGRLVPAIVLSQGLVDWGI